MKPKLAASHRRAEEARLAHRIESLEVHRRGLDRAVEPFGEGGLDPQRWRAAFESTQPADVVARSGVTGEAVELLRQHAVALIESAGEWLERHGIAVGEPASP